MALDSYKLPMSITPIIFVIGVIDIGVMRLLTWLSILRKSCNSDLIGQCAQKYTDIVYL